MSDDHNILLKLETPTGSTLEAIQSPDKDNPGIFIINRLPNGKDGASVLVEYDSALNRIMLRAWSHENPDEDPIVTMPMSPISQKKSDKGE